jgi:hypothetical protein
MSRIFLFNPNYCSVQYMVNGGRTPLVQPNRNDYTPRFISVKLQKYIETGIFCYGQNDFIVIFRDEDEDNRKRHDTYTIEIPPIHSLLDDLIIYSYRKMLLVMDTRGLPVLPQGLLIERSPEYRSHGSI